MEEIEGLFLQSSFDVFWSRVSASNNIDAAEERFKDNERNSAARKSLLQQMMQVVSRNNSAADISCNAATEKDDNSVR